MSRFPISTSAFKALISSLLLISGILSLIDSSGFTFIAAIHRVPTLMSLNLGNGIVILNLILLITWSLVYLIDGIDWWLGVPLIGVAAIPLFGPHGAVAVISLGAFLIGLKRWKDWPEVVFWVLFTFLILESSALIYWALLPIVTTSFLEPAAGLESDVFYLSSTLASVPLFILLFGWVPKLFRNKTPVKEVTARKSTFTKYNWALLALSLCVAAVAGLYPYASNINPHGLIVGYDNDSYLDAAKQIASDPMNIFTLFEGQRPVVLGLIYLTLKVTGADALSVLISLSSVLLPLMAASSAFLAWEVFRDGDVASLASLLTACGVFTVESMYGFFLSNMLGLGLSFLSLALLFRGLRTRSHLTFILSVLVGLLVLYSHNFTFYLYFGALALVCLVYLLLHRTALSNFEAKWVIIILVTFTLILVLSGSAEFGVSMLSPQFTSQAGWPSSGYTSISAGFTFNLLLFALAAIGAWRTTGKDFPKLYLSIIIALSGIAFIFLTEVYQFRLLINIPLGILAAFGVQEARGTLRSRNTQNIFLLLVIVSILTYLLRSLGNLI